MSAVETRRPEPVATWRDPRVPPREVCVVRYLLDRWAQDRPDRVAMVFEGGEALNRA
jgi:crotonobetaine/carnitine-CoA ligase